MRKVEASMGRKIFYLLNELNTGFHKNLEGYFARWSLTSSQILVLALLDKHKEMKISEIASSMGLADSNISGIVDRLENSDFVERTRSTADRRIVKVKLTSKAHELKKEFDLNVEEFFSQLLNRTSQDDLENIIANLEKLKSLISQKLI